MITKEDLELSAMSYTNKDFGSIYPEMLDIAKELTNSWDPSQSNESDPGVVLLKEAAFVADHNNYNIDKNILENFLPSATQDKSVRNIVEMNGYTPRYYVSSSGMVSFRYKYGEGESNKSFTIPAFTLVISDAEGTVSYTQIEDLNIISQDGKESVASTCRFIEGTMQQLVVNNSTTILLDNLDDNNRIYLPEVNVAQNGIFVKYVNDTAGIGLWERNNYILTQPPGSRMYKVDFDSDKGVPYIEFPTDIAAIIGDGLVIGYITTTGLAGNVSANILNTMVSPIEFEDGAGTLRNTNNFIKITNPTAILNGKDPETIDEMYQSFKKVVGTFETLVTCRDYENAAFNLENNDEPIVSNCHVTDRRTDYNMATNIVTRDEFGNYFENISTQSNKLVFKNTKPATPTKGDFVVNGSKFEVYDGHSWVSSDVINLNDFAVLSEAMTPYDITIYALEPYRESEFKHDLIDGYAGALKKSFKPATSSTVNTIKTNINSLKSINHNYKAPLQDGTHLFKNSASIKVSIKPYTMLTTVGRDEVIYNVNKAISDNYNPRHLEYGEDIDTTALKQVIINSDKRIRDVDLSPISYDLYKVTSGGDERLVTSDDIVELIAKNVLNGRVRLYDFNKEFDFKFGQSDSALYSDVTSITTELPIDITIGEGSSETSSIDKVNVFKLKNIEYVLYRPGKTAGTPQIISEDSAFELSTGDLLVVRSGNITTAYKTSSNTKYSIELQGFNSLIYSELTQAEIEDPKTITEFRELPGDGSIVVTKSTSVSTIVDSTINVDRTLRENEAVQIIYPSYYSDKTYSVYVNYRYIGENKIPANVDRTLAGDEKLVLQYTSNGVITTDIYTKGDVINSTFDITKTDDLSTSGVRKTYTDINGVTVDSAKFATLSSNQTISHRILMETLIKDKTINAYWITNSEDNKLFEDGTNIKILGNDEYFIYTNSTSSEVSELMILGAGTKLKYSNASIDWSLPNVDTTISSITTYGYSAVPWKAITFEKGAELSIVEMNVVTLGNGDSLTISGWTATKLVSDSTQRALTSADKINNVWKMCNGNIRYNDVVLPGIDDFYYIRSRLDLSLSSVVPVKVLDNQTIKLGASSTPINEDSYILASNNSYILGDSNVRVNSINLYTYKEVITPPQSVSVSDVEQTFEYKLSFVGTQALVPVFVSDDAVTCKYKVGTGSYKNLTKGLNIISISNDNPQSALTTSLIINLPASSTANEYVQIYNFKVINGFNSLLSIDATHINGAIIEEKIDSIIAGSDKPSISFDKTYEPDKDSEIDLNRYCVTNLNQDGSLRYVSKAFDNPLIMFDSNNVASSYTLPYIDLQRSEITVIKSMIEG